MNIPTPLHSFEESSLNTWRVVLVDNTDRDTVSDVLYAICCTREGATALQDYLNTRFATRESSIYYSVYEPGSKLFKYKP